MDDAATLLHVSDSMHTVDADAETLLHMSDSEKQVTSYAMLQKQFWHIAELGHQSSLQLHDYAAAGSELSGFFKRMNLLGLSMITEAVGILDDDVERTHTAADSLDSLDKAANHADVVMKIKKFFEDFEGITNAYDDGLAKLESVAKILNYAGLTEDVLVMLKDVKELSACDHEAIEAAKPQLIEMNAQLKGDDALFLQTHQWSSTKQQDLSSSRASLLEQHLFALTDVLSKHNTCLCSTIGPKFLQICDAYQDHPLIGDLARKTRVHAENSKFRCVD